MKIIVYDFGTSAVKTCLFDISSTVKMICHTSAEYNMYILENGGVEQDENEWWNAIVSSTKDLFTKTEVKPSEIIGISFCAQMQSVVLVDQNGNVLRRPMNYLDTRAYTEFKKGIESGLIRINGCDAFKLFRNLYINKTASISVKDPVYKYKWVENNEPQIFKNVYKWLDVNDYLAFRCTGNIVRTVDSAFSTFLYDTRKGKEGWNIGLAKMYGVAPEHLPKIINCTEKAGNLTKQAASELRLTEGIPVFSGGDATLTGIGAGCTTPGQTHIYIGTSGWVITLIDHQVVDPLHSITGVMSALPGMFHYYAELETAGICFEWVKDHLALDEIGIYLEKKNIPKDHENIYKSLYDYLSYEVNKVPPGANGIIFTPWMHGNRSPFEDSNAGGIFFNLKLENGKRDMIRAVLEGICFHLRWLLECEAQKIKTSDTIRFVGGGALSPVTCQMLADITGKTIETIDEPQNAGAIGAAMMTALGMNIIDSSKTIEKMIPIKATYRPDASVKAIYERNYKVFCKLYNSNAKHFKALNADLRKH